MGTPRMVHSIWHPRYCSTNFSIPRYHLKIHVYTWRRKRYNSLNLQKCIVSCVLVEAYTYRLGLYCIFYLMYVLFEILLLFSRNQSLKIPSSNEIIVGDASTSPWPSSPDLGRTEDVGFVFFPFVFFLWVPRPPLCLNVCLI